MAERYVDDWPPFNADSSPALAKPSSATGLNYEQLIRRVVTEAINERYIDQVHISTSKHGTSTSRSTRYVRRGAVFTLGPLSLPVEALAGFFLGAQTVVRDGCSKVDLTKVIGKTADFYSASVIRATWETWLTQLQVQAILMAMVKQAYIQWRATRRSRITRASRVMCKTHPAFWYKTYRIFDADPARASKPLGGTVLSTPSHESGSGDAVADWVCITGSFAMNADKGEFLPAYCV